MGIRVHNLYCDANGKSHWRDIQSSGRMKGRKARHPRRQPANGIIFRQTQAEHDRPWHPRRAGNTSSTSMPASN